jgi:hypothetical protein
MSSSNKYSVVYCLLNVLYVLRVLFTIMKTVLKSKIESSFILYLIPRFIFIQYSLQLSPNLKHICQRHLKSDDTWILRFKRRKKKKASDEYI